MLNVIRKQAGSWVVKALLMLLVVSFGIWGIGDVFFGGGQNPAVASVGDSEVSSQELSEAFQRAVDGLQRQAGTAIDREQAIRLGLMERTLQDLVTRRLIDLEAQKLGLTVTDDTLRQLITGDDLFHTAGRFDRARFEQLLQANGMTEESYLASLRQDVLRSTLTGSIVAPASVPRSLVDTLYRYRNEQRRGRYVVIDKTTITDLPTPTDDELQTLYQDNQKRFTAPQYRTITFVTLEPEDLVAEFTPDENALKAAYDERQAEFRTPETRTIEQLLAKDRATIDQAASLAAEGKGFAEIATTLKDQGVVADGLGKVTRKDMPLGLADAAFAPAQGEVSKPTESPFGWHLFRASAIEPEKVRPFAQVRDQLAHELGLAEAHDRIPSVANQLDDEIAAGNSIKQAAEAVGLEAKTVTRIDPQGKDETGARPADLPSWPEFLTTAFEAAPNEPSLLQETDAGNYFVLQVDEVVEPRLKSLDEVRAEVVKLRQDEQRDKLAQERAQALLKEIRDAGSIGVVARDRGLIVQAIEPVKRTATGNGKDLNQAAIGALFATAPDKLAQDPIEVGNGFAVIMTDEIIPANPSADSAGVAQLRQELEREIQGDLLQQFQVALQREHPVEVHAAALNRLMSGDDLDGGSSSPPPLSGLGF